VPHVREADVVFLAVGTPIRRGDGHADLTYVLEALEELAPYSESGVVITTKSTVPVVYILIGRVRSRSERMTRKGQFPNGANNIALLNSLVTASQFRCVAKTDARLKATPERNLRGRLLLRSLREPSCFS